MDYVKVLETRKKFAKIVKNSKGNPKNLIK
jgi:hypothetical protein